MSNALHRNIGEAFSSPSQIIGRGGRGEVAAGPVPTPMGQQIDQKNRRRVDVHLVLLGP